MKADEPRLILIDDARHDPLLFAELLALIGTGEKEAVRHLVLEQEDAIFPKDLALKLQEHEAQLLKAQTPLTVSMQRPRVRRKESLEAMMRRIAAETKPLWKTPELREEFLCTNCDGAPDGGHADDEFCIRTLEQDRTCPASCSGCTCSATPWPPCGHCEEGHLR